MNCLSLIRTFLLGCLALSGTVKATEITLYEHANFAGAELTLRRSNADLSSTGFNDRASSLVVVSGRWELCTDAGFGGYCAVFEPGEYPVLDGRLNDRISSARETGSNAERRPTNDYGQGAIEIYEEPGFRGRSVRLAADTPALVRAGGAAGSVNVQQGTWQLCSGTDFSGSCRTYAPGRYPELGYGAVGQIASARLVRSAGQAPAVISPGFPAAPLDQPARVFLFSEPGLQGASLGIAGPVSNLERSNFNDAAASIYVESGTWVACRDANFRGECRVFGPGRYDDLQSVGLFRSISSIRPGASPAETSTSRRAPSASLGVQLFSEPDFRGEQVTVERDARNLERFGFDRRAASLWVTSGTWEVCTEEQYGGDCAVFRPGRYPRLGGLTQRVTSVRQVQ